MFFMGPLHGFWLFSFERCNGVLGSQPHNNRSIEIQLMDQFLRDNMHLELLHRADTKPLAEIFGPAVAEHAQQFSSLSPAPTCS